MPTKKKRKPSTGRTAKKTKKPAPRVKEKPVTMKEETTLVLRTCPADMIAKGTFCRPDGSTGSYSMLWPRSGLVECPDWNPEPVCGNGLHGLAWGNGDWTLLSSDDDAIWMVVEVATADIVRIDTTKVKFPRGNVVFAGSRVEATVRVLCGSEAMSNAFREAQEWGRKNDVHGDYSKSASSGNYSTSASSGNYSKSASSGDSSKSASSGNYSTSASSGDYSKSASSGDYSKSASSGDYSKSASSGDYSTSASSGNSGIAATLGTGGMAKAGPNGLLIVTYWVEAEKRFRACVGNVGEDGVLADTWYKVEDAKLVAVST